MGYIDDEGKKEGDDLGVDLNFGLDSVEIESSVDHEY
jgi:hypothetical protein